MDLLTRFRDGRQRGIDERTIGNLVAIEIGVRPIVGGWTRRELAHLVFLRWLDEHEPDILSEVDRADVWP